jgi:hypothetical protein
MRRRFLRHGSRLAMLALGLTIGAGCAGRSALETDLTEDAGFDAGQIDAGPTPITKSDQLDVLFVVDNSPNTGAFHDMLAASVAYLTGRLTSPACVNGLGNVVATTPSPTDPCPTGVREFSPVRDLHLAVISTSLGGHGADTCSPASASFNPTQNDGGRLLTRGPGGGTVPTYLDKGFLAWDPQQKLSPPGESDPAALTAKLQNLIEGTGSAGCGFESQLESIYRFLVDPDPYLNIQIVNGQATLVGTDAVLLQQRADFLRPGSALAIVLITDENDCSTRDGSQYFFGEQGGDPNNPNSAFHLPPARSVCATNPDDPCCASCGQGTPPGCLPTSADAACLGPPQDNKSDPINLRCFDQKRRFGVDFLQPIDRYVHGLSDPTIPTRDGSLVPNPLFAGNRSPELVTLTGIVGVPWQDVAVEPKALATGLKTVAEIDWNLLLGDPQKGTPPADPLMIESIDPRTGANPPTGATLAPPSAGPLANPINGHERDIPDRDDLQYACIYPMIQPINCTGPTCPCNPPGNDPICQSADGSYGPQAVFGRALPGTRELRLLQQLGDRAAVASVCAVSGSGTAAPTFGYKPAVDAMLRLLRGKLE